MKDSKGIEIQEGDTVVVARRRGSSQWLDVRTVYCLNGDDGKPVLETPTRSHRRNGKPSKEYVSYLVYKGSSDAILVANPITRIELKTDDPDKFVKGLVEACAKVNQDPGDESPNYGIGSDGEYFTRNADGSTSRW